MARNNDLITALRAVETALNDLDDTLGDISTGGAAAGGAPLPGAAPFAAAPGIAVGGGRAVPSPGARADAPTVGGALAAVRSHPVISGLATVAAGAALGGVGQGVISAARGGTFEAGALSGLNAALSRVPFFGEFSGAAPRERIKEEVRQRVAGPVAEIRARGGDVTPGLEAFLQRLVTREATRRERSLQESEILLERGLRARSDPEQNLRNQIDRFMQNRNNPSQGVEQFR